MLTNCLLLILLVRGACGTLNISLIGELLQQSRHYQNITTVPIFVGDGLSDEHLDTLTQYIDSELKVPRYIFTTNAPNVGWNPLRNHIKHDTLSIVLCASENDKIWPIVDKRLRRLRQTRLLVVLTREQANLHSICAKLWRLQFLKVLVVATNTQLYTYMPYPRVELLAVNAAQSSDHFPLAQKNLRGYNISVTVENDIPRIFFIADHAGHRQIKGVAYQAFTHFMRRLNTSMHILNPHDMPHITSSVNMSNILRMISQQEVEISMHPYTGIQERDGIMSYPIFKASCCLIIPVQNEIPRYMYLLRPFTYDTWLLVAFTIVYVSCTLSWLSPRLLHIVSRYERLSRSLLESIAQLLWPASNFQIQSPGLRYFFVYLQLALLGFIISTWYSNLLSSFFTTILVGKQADTFEDLIAARIPIMIKSYETHLLLQQVPPHLVAQVESLLVPVNSSVQMTHLLSFNTSYCYPVTEERWIFFALQQQYANKPIYRYSNICLGTPCVSFPMRTDSHLEPAFTQFIMDVQMAGLDNYWLVSDFKDALEAGYVRFIDNIFPFKALDTSSLLAAWYLVGCGWLISISVFIVESYRKMSTFNKV